MTSGAGEKVSESSTSKRRLEAAERQRKALELRKAGATFEQIASELGYRGPSGAYRAVHAALKKTLQEPADEVRQIELSRLDRLLVGVWTKATRGDIRAIGAALRVMERRARLLGLDAPTKYEIANFLRSEDWSKIKAALKTALENHPEAAEAVADALRTIGDE